MNMPLSSHFVIVFPEKLCINEQSSQLAKFALFAGYSDDRFGMLNFAAINSSIGFNLPKLMKKIEGLERCV